ncbi:hypothetical protein ZWY2020_007015 [Hordeum vulgare]|nr:hypothetical protein ZWY2020_007015 [Hordeum vulgare]
MLAHPPTRTTFKFQIHSRSRSCIQRRNQALPVPSPGSSDLSENHQWILVPGHSPISCSGFPYQIFFLIFLNIWPALNHQILDIGSFSSHPFPAEIAPDLSELEEEEADEEDEVEHPDSQSDSPSSSQDGEKNMATDLGSHSDGDFKNKAIPEFFNGADGDAIEEHGTKVQPNPSPWRQRVRLGKIPDRRATSSGRVSALENSMKKYADKKSEFVVKPEISQEFDSLAEAYDFYNLYSWEIGFGIKYGQCRRNVEKCKTAQDIVCGCADGVVLNLGVPLEFHASKVYTSAMYELFQHAIYLSGSFVLQEAWESEQGSTLPRS